jgi:biotin operon repressor
MLKKSDVLEELKRAKGVTFVSLSPLAEGSHHVILKLLWHDKPITLSVTLSEVLAFDIPEKRGYDLTKTGKIRTRKRAPRGQNAKDSDQPYTNPAVLKALFDEHGSLRAVADNLGVSETVVSKWWLAHGFETLRPQPDAKTRQQHKRIIRDALQAGTMPTQQAMAEQLGISKATVNRLVKQVKAELKP